MAAFKNITVLFVCGIVFLFDTGVYAEKSISTLMEEANYQEEMVGDVNAALAIYEKVITDEQARRPQVARATYRAGMCYLKRGDSDKAAQLFNDVIAKFADQKIYVTKSQKELSKLNPSIAGSGPQVVSTTPATFATDVDPSLDKISVTFNVPMVDKSWSWCKMGENYPETIGSPGFDEQFRTCTLGVKLQPGTAYMVGFNISPYLGFHAQSGQPAKAYVLVFATNGANGKPTAIPEQMIAKAKQINSAESVPQMEQEIHDTIDANGLIHFKSPNKVDNGGSEPITTTGFVNSDFVTLTTMYDENGTAIPFETTHEGNIYRYKITFNKPIMPGEKMVYYTEGTMKGLIKPVTGMKDVYEYYMRHSPSAGQRVLRIETYLLPKGAELISTTPKSIKIGEENGRIKLSLDEIIPANGSLITSFQYKLPNAVLAPAEEPLNLLSGPWDGIGIRLKLTTPVGADIGQMVWRSSKIDIKGAPGWRIESFMNVTVANMQQYTFVDALAQTYAPVASQTKNTMLGNFEAQFQADKVILTRKADSNDVVKTIPITSPVFDNEQALYVIRKMPLKEGYTGSFNIFPVESGIVLQCRIEVLKGIETITINSGPIPCYKIKLSVLSEGISVLEHALWISTDANRYLVKYDSGEAVMEMIAPIVEGQNMLYGHSKGRVFLPKDWEGLYSNQGIQELMQIMAPGLPFWAVLVKQPAGEDCNTSSEIAHKDSEKLAGFFKNYTPVAQSWTDLTISKMPATSYYAAYEDKDKQMVEYRTYILNKPEVFWFVFRIEKDQFENFKPQFDLVINSFHDTDM